jgi:hypothetical protein
LSEKRAKTTASQFRNPAMYCGALYLCSRRKQHLEETDIKILHVSTLALRVRNIFQRQPAWPRHEALLRFDVSLQRPTTYMCLRNDSRAFFQ